MNYYVKPKKNGYDVINLSTNKVERSFCVKNIYNVMNALLNDLYIKYGILDRNTNTLIMPHKKFNIYLNEWVAINRLHNDRHINFTLHQTQNDPTSYEQLSLYWTLSPFGGILCSIPTGRKRSLHYVTQERVLLFLFSLLMLSQISLIVASHYTISYFCFFASHYPSKG